MLGLYPTWFDPTIGSSWVIAFIATIHVLFSHAAVGGAILMGWLANRAVRKNRPEYLYFIRRYGLFLLVFSYVLGSITGPGIWFASTVASPRGISALIHTFVFWWATEWVFFLIEVFAVYLLVYLAGRVDPKTHTRISVIFACSSTATLLVIVGVLNFMMWPGDPSWYTEGGVLNAFFGPGTFAQDIARLGFVLTITGVVAGMVAARMKDGEEKNVIVRVISAIGLIGLAVGVAASLWYLKTLPENALEQLSSVGFSHMGHMILIALALVVLWFAFTAARPGALRTWAAAVMTLVVLVAGLAPEETAREIMRKPWIAGQYVYANQVVGRDVPALGIVSELPVMEKKGVLATAPFVPEQLRRVTPENSVEAGSVLALTLCSNCHSLSNSGRRPIAKYFPANADKKLIADYLDAGLHRGLITYMPAIPLPPAERDALADYLSTLTSSNKEAGK
jgi:cytochrome bd-type quinol oxidase subunit 1